MNKLGGVQKSALRVISHQWDSIYEDLLNIVKIQKLQERRLKLKLTLVYKIVHGLCYFPGGVFVLHRSHAAREWQNTTPCYALMPVPIAISTHLCQEV